MGRTSTSAPNPQAVRFARRLREAAGSTSTKTARAAPRLRASIPTAPVPA